MGTFAIGCLIGAEWPRLARLARFWPIALVASSGAAILLLAESHVVRAGMWDEGSGAYLWPSRLPQTLTWSVCLLWIGREFRATWAPIRELSEHSLGIYLLHPIPLGLIGPLTSALPSGVRVPILMISCLASAYVLVRLLGQTPLGAVALGEPATTEANARPASLRATAA